MDIHSPVVSMSNTAVSKTVVLRAKRNGSASLIHRRENHG